VKFQNQCFCSGVPVLIAGRWKDEAVMLMDAPPEIVQTKRGPRYLFPERTQRVMVQRNHGPAKMVSVKILRPINDAS
jgi:hypothetical protein